MRGGGWHGLIVRGRSYLLPSVLVTIRPGDVISRRQAPPEGESSPLHQPAPLGHPGRRGVGSVPFRGTGRLGDSRSRAPPDRTPAAGGGGVPQGRSWGLAKLDHCRSTGRVLLR